MDSITVAPAPVALIAPDPAPDVCAARPGARAHADADGRDRRASGTWASPPRSPSPAPGFPVVGMDASEERLAEVRRAQVDMAGEDRGRLARALLDGRLSLTGEAAELREADVVVICVPDPGRRGAASPTRASWRRPAWTAVHHARAGQTHRPHQHHLRGDHARAAHRAARRPRAAGGRGRVRRLLPGADRPGHRARPPARAAARPGRRHARAARRRPRRCSAGSSGGCTSSPRPRRRS